MTVTYQLSEGKVMTSLIQQFCDADQELMMTIRKQMSTSDGFREWTDNTGKHTSTAKFAGFQSDEKVLLQSEAGKTIAVPIDRLGQAEQEFLKKLKDENHSPT